jgi:hypothetical protein
MRQQLSPLPLQQPEPPPQPEQQREQLMRIQPAARAAKRRANKASRGSRKQQTTRAPAAATANGVTRRRNPAKSLDLSVLKSAPDARIGDLLPCALLLALTPNNNTWR